MTLSREDTNVLKGLALLLLLAHHLFYINDGQYNDMHIIGRYNLVQTIGYSSKICVAIFVFLSGFGLSVKYQRVVSIEKKRFYAERFTKLYINYWIIWLLFMPISLIIFGPSLHQAYGSMIPVKLLLDFTGLINVIGLYGYNPTWWFYSCIILLYAFFPFIHACNRKGFMPFMLIASVVLYLIPGNIALCARLFLPSFLIGVYMAENKKNTPPLFACAIMLIMLLGERVYMKYEILCDAITVMMLTLVYVQIKLPKWLSAILHYLGRHSMNIFLFHTFIYYLWFRDYIYISRSPLVIYMTLLISCIIISIAIEYVKGVLKLDKIQSQIISLLCPTISA